jgi:glycosyltransferase involved in cell wall biosynthesis
MHATPEKEKARVLVLTSTYPRWRGDTVPTFVHELARRLAQEFEIHVLAPHTAGASEEESLDGVSVHRFRYLPVRYETLAYGGGILPGLRSRPWRAAALLPFLIAEYAAAAKLLRTQDFSLIHAHWLVPHGAIAARFKRQNLALLCTSHGSDLFSLNAALFRSLKRAALKHANAITVVSDALRRKIETLTGETDRIHIMPMGVDTVKFCPPAPGATRSGLLYVGRLVREKGLHTLLSALHDGSLSGSNPHLTVIGSGPAESLYKRQVANLGLESQVTFLGALPNPELATFYQRAQALIFPSLLGSSGQQEGMGLVPIEALACECPVIASCLPAVSEIIRDRETGLLFTPNDAPGLAGCIADVLNDPDMARQTAQAGRKLVEKRYGWDVAAGAYRDLYLKLISPQRNSPLD